MNDFTQKIAYMEIDQYDSGDRKRPVLDASDYAVILVGDDQVYPKFPIDSKAHVKESAEALKKVQDKLPDEIVKVAQYYINQRNFYFTQKLASDDNDIVMPTDGNVVVLNTINQNEYLEKLSSGVSLPSKFALELDNGEKYVPINDEGQIKEACEFIKSMRGAYSWKIPGKYRVKIARSLVKEAAFYFMDIPKSVRRYAQPTTTIDDLKRAAKARIKVAENYLDRVLDKKDVDYLKKIASGGEDNLIKVCEFFNDIDEKTGYADLKRRTNQGDAYDELFVIKSARLKEQKPSNRFLTVTEQKLYGEK